MWDQGSGATAVKLQVKRTKATEKYPYQFVNGSGTHGTARAGARARARDQWPMCRSSIGGGPVAAVQQQSQNIGGVSSHRSDTGPLRGESGSRDCCRQQQAKARRRWVAARSGQQAKKAKKAKKAASWSRAEKAQILSSCCF